MSRYQKGKTNLDFAEARDSEWQWHQLGRMQVCTSLQSDNHTSTLPLSFLQARCPSCRRPSNSIKALKAVNESREIFEKSGLTDWDICCCVTSRWVCVVASAMMSQLVSIAERVLLLALWWVNWSVLRSVCVVSSAMMSQLVSIAERVCCC